MKPIYLVTILLIFLSCKKGDDESNSVVPEDSTVIKNAWMLKGIYGVNIPDMKRTAGYGFNVIQSYQFSGMNVTQLRQYMDSAARYNLKVLFHLGVQTYSTEVFDRVKQMVTEFKGHSAMHAWYLADEPSVSKISVADLKKIYDYIKESDKVHPVYSSNWELNNFKSTLDFDLPQFYNGPASALRKGNHLNGYIDRAAGWNVKWIAIANTHDCIDFAAYHQPGAETLSPSFLYNKIIPGSPEETAVKNKILTIQQNLQNPPFQTLGSYPDSPVKIRGQAWDLIARGSDGLFYWLLQPEDQLNARWGYYTIFVRPQLKQALVDVLSETSALWYRVQKPLENSTKWMAGANNEVLFWCRQSGKSITIIAVNESESNMSIRTTIPVLAGRSLETLTVNKENRTVKAANGVLEDNFLPNEAHVYLLTLK